jgi:hypothetical protein
MGGYFCVTCGLICEAGVRLLRDELCHLLDLLLILSLRLQGRRLNWLTQRIIDNLFCLFLLERRQFLFLLICVLNLIFQNALPWLQETRVLQNETFW